MRKYVKRNARIILPINPIGCYETCSILIRIKKFM